MEFNTASTSNITNNKEDDHILKKDIDTNCYENIIYNKKDIAIKLFNELDKQILNINKKMKRNYLIRSVVYKLNKRLIEVQVNQSDLLISFHKEIKKFDVKDKLFDRRGYEDSSLCYSCRISSLDEIPYVIELCNKLNNYLESPKDNLADNLFDVLSKKITSISSNITSHTTNKGLMFKNKRNFTIISKKKYGIYIGLLNVDDDNNTLSIVGRTNYEPLCRCFKLTKEEDIDIIMPYIVKSYELSKYNPIDLKNNFVRLYYNVK